jgi:predicted nuclease of predicted toxin-antitoxin system
MRFLADAGVSRRVVEWLKQQGYDAIHLRDEGLHKISDTEIFAKAIVEGRIIIAFDLDFGETIALTGGKQVSVIIFRLHNTRTLHVIEHLMRH